VKYASSVLLGCLIASAQTKDYKIACDTVDNSAGCKSYNEMVEKKDKEIVSLLNGTPIVCFNQTEDAFHLFSFTPPQPQRYLTGKSPSEPATADGFLIHTAYEDGVQVDQEMIAGKWHKFSFEDQPTFVSSPGQSVEASISDSELDLTEKFENVMHTNSTRTIRVRRSTLRFVLETIAPDSDRTKPLIYGSRKGLCADFK
jgi:hypothetical protein